MEFICPNSQSHEVATYPVKGLDEVYNQLRKAAVETDDSAYHFWQLQPFSHSLTHLESNHLARKPKVMGLKILKYSIWKGQFNLF